MNDIIGYLENLGVPDAEAKLYFKILEVGPKSVRELASLLKINRATAYSYINHLFDLGLIMKAVKGSRTLIALNDPVSSLQELVNKGIRSAKTIEKDFPSVIQAITTAYPSYKEKEIGDAEIKYYKGHSGVRKIYRDALKVKELCSYARVQETGGLFPDNVEFFNAAFKQNPALTVREILYDSPLVEEQAPKLLSKNKRYSYKLMPSDLKLTSEDILIYDGKVAIINYKDKVSSVVLQSFDYYNNSKELFDFIWSRIP